MRLCLSSVCRAICFFFVSQFILMPVSSGLSQFILMPVSSGLSSFLCLLAPDSVNSCACSLRTQFILMPVSSGLSQFIRMLSFSSGLSQFVLMPVSSGLSQFVLMPQASRPRHRRQDDGANQGCNDGVHGSRPSAPPLPRPRSIRPCGGGGALAQQQRHGR